MRDIKGVTIDTMIFAKEIGIRFPEYYKKGKVDVTQDMYDAGIYYFKKPEDAIDMSYLVYWNGKKFRGGYIIYENNYSMPGRGQYIPGNGITFFPEDTKEIRNILKKARQYHESDDGRQLETGWYKFNLVLYDGDIHFWGIELIEVLSLPFQLMNCVSETMNMSYLQVMDMFNSDEKNRKPVVKYIASLPLFADKLDEPVFGDIVWSFGETVSNAWKNLYRKAAATDKYFHYYLGIDEYHRACHYKFKISLDSSVPDDMQKE